MEFTKKITVGEILADLRKRKKVTQTTAAKALRMDLKKLQNIEDDKITIRKTTLRTMCKYYNVPISAVLVKLLGANGTKEQQKFVKSAEPIIQFLIDYLLGNMRPKNEVKIKKDIVSEN